MLISQTLEYALRAMVFIATGTGQSYTTLQISQATKVPQAYLSKVLQLLVKAKLIQSQRGLGGGFVLNKEAKDICILDIVNAVDPLERIESCPLGISSHGNDLCRLHKKLDEAISVIEKDFTDTSITDIITNPTSVLPLCERPAM